MVSNLDERDLYDRVVQKRVVCDNEYEYQHENYNQNISLTLELKKLCGSLIKYTGASCDAMVK